ncbi:MAG: hypothetical protein ABSH28_24455, partial [Acidobacteriota bacterium]
IFQPFGTRTVNARSLGSLISSKGSSAGLFPADAPKTGLFGDATGGGVAGAGLGRDEYVPGARTFVPARS